MESVFLRVFNNSIAASWLVLAVLVARWLMKKAPKNIRCVLWGLVGLRLCLPVSIKSAFSLVPSAQTVRPEIVYAARPAIDSGIGAVDRVVNPVIAQAFAPTPAASANPLQIWLFIAAWVWGIGLAAMLLYSAVSYLLLRVRVASSVPLRDNIRLSDRISSPFLMGIVRPRLYLPMGLDEEVMELAIAHEWAHVERRDHVFRPLGFVLLAVYWFNPLLWLSFVLFCRDMELACDERVLEKLGTEKKKAYSRALLACSAPHRSIAACPVAFGETGVKGRIENILRYKKVSRWVLAVAAVLCAVLAVGFLTNPVTVNTEKIYAPVIELYRSAAEERWSEEQMAEAGINPRLAEYCMANGYGHAEFVNGVRQGPKRVGYLIRDIDGDGVEELAISCLDNLSLYFDYQKDYRAGQIVDLYTIENGQPVKMEMDAFWAALCADNQLIQSVPLTVEGETYTFIGKQMLSGGKMLMTEGILLHMLSAKDMAQTGGIFDEFYRVTDNEFSPDETKRIGEEEAIQIVLAYYDQVITEAYTPLSEYVE